MERLTERNKYGTAIPKILDSYPLIDKLASYEDAEEQGLLLRLPCKVGTILYYPHCAWIDHKIQWLVNDLTVENVDHALRFNGYIGKTVFLTREEAEQALAEMQKG